MSSAAAVSSSRIRRAPNKTVQTKSRQAAATSTTPNELASRLARDLSISNVQPMRQQYKVASKPVMSPADGRILAMKCVNETSKLLTTALQAGWTSRAGTSSKMKDAPDLKSVSSAAKAVHELRQFNADDLDVERAAGSLAGKLVSAEYVSAND